VPTLLEATRLRAMRADPEAVPDHLPHACRRPDLSSPSEGCPSACQQARPRCQRFGAPVRFPPGRGVRSQALDSPRVRLLEPWTDCALAHSKRGREVFVLPSLCMPFPGAQPSSFAPIAQGSMSCSSLLSSAVPFRSFLFSAQINKRPLLWLSHAFVASSGVR
jgi:hypothetical protein